jgi:hypothetical protein
MGSLNAESRMCRQILSQIVNAVVKMVLENTYAGRNEEFAGQRIVRSKSAEPGSRRPQRYLLLSRRALVLKFLTSQAPKSELISQTGSRVLGLTQPRVDEK